MAKIKFKISKTQVLWLIGILFVMSVTPGEGTKVSDQQALVTTDYLCTTVDDCPTCVGGGIYDYNATDPSFLGELSYVECVGGRCEMSDACLIWSCPPSAQKLNTTGGLVDCESVKQTILDNTIQKFNENPVILLLIIGAIVAFIMLK